MSVDRSLTGDALSGVSWTWAASFASLAMQLVYTAVMSRLLEPAAFGLVAAAMVGLRFASYFGKFGIGNAVVQRDVLEPDDVRVATTLSILMGVGAAVIAALTAPIIAGLINQTEAALVMRWLALGLVVAGIGAVPEALLRRSMRFRALAAATVSSFAVGYIGVGITSAVIGWGVWSLVAATLTQAVVLAGMVSAIARPSLRPSLDRRRAKRLLTFGGAVSITGFLEFIGSNLDTLAVGRWIGASGLGQYSRGTYLVSLPVEQLTTAASKVLMPSLSKVQHEPERFTRGLLSSISLMSVVVMLPIAAGAAAAPDLVRLVLGPGWDEAASVLPLVGLAYGLSLLSHVPAVALEARGAVGVRLLVQLVSLAALTCALGFAIYLGPTLHRLALAWVIGEAVRHALYWVTMRRVLHLELRAVAQRFAYGATLAALGAAPLVWWVRVADVSPVVAMAAGVAISLGLLAFVATAWRTAAVRQDVERLLRTRSGGVR